MTQSRRGDVENTVFYSLKAYSREMVALPVKKVAFFLLLGYCNFDEKVK